MFSIYGSGTRSNSSYANTGISTGATIRSKNVIGNMTDGHMRQMF